MRLEPLRTHVELRIREARAALNAMPEQFKVSLGYDAATVAIEELNYIGACASDIRAEVYNAINGREGFDTWPKKELDEFIQKAGRVAVALEALSISVKSLRTAEAVEISRLQAHGQAVENNMLARHPDVI